MNTSYALGFLLSLFSTLRTKILNVGSHTKTYLFQLATLCKKNALLSRRNWKGTLAQVVSPFLILLMLVG